MRNFGMHARTALGGTERPSARYGARNTGAGSNLLPTINPLFPRGNFSQTVIDIFALIFCAAFVVVTGLGLFLSFFFLVFGG